MDVHRLTEGLPDLQWIDAEGVAVHPRYWTGRGVYRAPTLRLSIEFLRRMVEAVEREQMAELDALQDELPF